MKKKTLNSVRLSLNKKKISNLTSNGTKGGADTFEVCTLTYRCPSIWNCTNGCPVTGGPTDGHSNGCPIDITVIILY